MFEACIFSQDKDSQSIHILPPEMNPATQPYSGFMSQVRVLLQFNSLFLGKILEFPFFKFPGKRCSLNRIQAVNYAGLNALIINSPIDISFLLSRDILPIISN